MLTKNLLREKMLAGTPAAGILLSAHAPWLVEIFGAAGFDYAILDCEHGPMDPQSVEAMTRAADAASITPLVRVPSNSPSEILRYLDAGAHGIVVPHISTLQDAERAASAARYPPLGTRSMATATKAAGYGMRVAAEHIEVSNREVLVILMIEDPAGIENAASIIGCKGVDAIIIGSLDLAMAMGHGAQTSHPQVQSAVAQVLAECKRQGKPIFMSARNPLNLEEPLVNGADFVHLIVTNWILQTARGQLNAIPALCAAGPRGASRAASRA